MATKKESAPKNASKASEELKSKTASPKAKSEAASELSSAGNGKKKSTGKK